MEQRAFVVEILESDPGALFVLNGDLDGDGSVGVVGLTEVILNWG